MDNILRKLFGFQTTQVILTAVELGIFTEIKKRAKDFSATVKNLTESLKLDLDATERLLMICVSLELINKSNEGVYVLSDDVARYLTDDSPESQVNFVKRMRDQYIDLAQLATAVKHGQAATCPKDIATTGQVEEQKLLYNADMVKVAGPPIVRAFDLSEYKKACDLAGGTGGLAGHLKQAYPEMEISVLEQPDVVKYATERASNGDITFIAGDVVAAQLPQSDLYLVGHLCMLFDDDSLTQLFRNAFTSLMPGGALLLCEALLNDSRTGPELVCHRDIAALVVASQGERTQQQYTELLKRAGFQRVQACVFDTHIYYDVILAQKS